MRIFIIADTHGLIDTGKIERFNFPEGYNLSKEDIVIIGGDAGVIWDEDTDKTRIEYYENKPWTTVYVDGNHENFTLLEQYEVVDFFGAKAHKISDSIYHIRRGEIVVLNGKTFLCFGGGFSHDVSYRELDYDWFRQELPTQEEVDNAIHNLERYNYKVDYIITHDVPFLHTTILGYQNLKTYNIMEKYKGDVLYINIWDFLQQQIFITTEYKAWFAGHYHRDQKIHGIQLLFNGIAEITDGKEGYKILKSSILEIMNRTYSKEELREIFQKEDLYMNYRKIGTIYDFGVYEPMMKATKYFDNQVVEKQELEYITKRYNEYCIQKREKECT